MVKKVALTLFVLMFINFFLPRLMPGDPFDFISVEDGATVVTLTEEQIDHYRAYYGLDKPMMLQFKAYILNVFKGDFGVSIYYNRPVSEMVFERIGWTLMLVFIAMMISSVIGCISGVAIAFIGKKNKTLDRYVQSFMVLISEVPNFIIGILMLIIFAVRLKWFPLSGGITPFIDHETVFSWLGDYIHHLILPVAVLVISSVGDFFLLARQSTVSVLNDLYIRTAEAKGLKKRHIILKHVLPNAVPPVIARFFSMMGMMIGGAVLIENVFSYPGVGRLMREAIGLRDYILIQGIFFFVAICVLLFNSVADLVYKRFNKKGLL